MMTGYDDLIPFVPIFVIPYILAYAQWIIGYFCIARTDEKYCKKIFYSEIAAKLMVCILFVLVPTTMERASLNRSYFSKRYAKIMGFSTILVMLSTVFIKQHVIWDVIGAIVVSEIGLSQGMIREYIIRQIKGLNFHS